MLSFIAFIESPLGKLASYVVGALVGVSMLAGIYLVWKHQVEQTALAKFNAAQLEQTLKDVSDQLQKTQALFELQQKSVQDLNNRRDELNKRLDGIDDFIAHAKDDRPSSDVIRGTIERLGRTK